MDLESASVNLFRNFERDVVFASPKRSVVPVSLVCGALGAGSTTLLKHMLQNRRNLLVTAIINDFAAVNIDQEFIQRSARKEQNPSSDIQLHELSNGCMCCVAQVGQKFEDVVGEILSDPLEQGLPDLVLIETSGVTDPMPIITKLEQRFGKMSRCRLDSVIAVVDSDAMHSSVLDGLGAGAAATLAQIRSADIILFNKIDLIDDQKLEVVHDFVEQQNPSALTFDTRFCKVALHHLVDIEPASSVSHVVSHEDGFFERPLVMSRTAGAIRRHRQLMQRSLQSSSSAYSSSAHLSDDGFVSVVFESSEPLYLSAFQDWLAFHQPAQLLRMKGILWFHSQRDIGSEFQMSGRRRYFFGSSGEKWLRAPSVSLVFIGRNLDATLIKQELREACLPPNPSSSTAIEEARRFLSQNKKLEVLDGTESPQGQVLFRLNGTNYFGISQSDLEFVHGVDFNAMNEEFLQALNCVGGAMFLTCVWRQSCLYLRWSAVGKLSLAQLSEHIEQQATLVFKRCTAKVQACSCGF